MTLIHKYYATRAQSEYMHVSLSVRTHAQTDIHILSHSWQLMEVVQSFQHTHTHTHTHTRTWKCTITDGTGTGWVEHMTTVTLPSSGREAIATAKTVRKNQKLSQSYM